MKRSDDTGSPPLLLLEQAFGARMLEGEDEWHDVGVVVRSSFFLLYRELRRHHKRIQSMETRPTASPSKHQETVTQKRLEALQAELEITRVEVDRLRASVAAASQQQSLCQCHCTREQDTLRLQLSQLEMRMTITNRTQHDHEKIVIQAMERQRSQLHQLKMLVGTEGEQRIQVKGAVHNVIVPRVRLLERHVRSLHRKLKRRPLVIALPDAAPSPQAMAKKYRQSSKTWASINDTKPRIHQTVTASKKESATGSPSECMETELDQTKPRIIGSRQSIDESKAYTTHATLRARYQLERTQQLRRLDRLRGSSSSTYKITVSARQRAAVNQANRTRSPASVSDHMPSPSSQWQHASRRPLEPARDHAAARLATVD